MDLSLAKNTIENGEFHDILHEKDLSSGFGLKKSEITGTKGISMKEAIRKSRVLIEALPYIQSFKGKIVVVKFGGSAMITMDTFQSILQDVVFMKSIGMKPIIVYGGGPYISSEMEKRGKKPLFINGFRVTDKETLDIAIDVLTNQIGKLIINHINEMGAKGVCVWGKNKTQLGCPSQMTKRDKRFYL